MNQNNKLRLWENTLENDFEFKKIYVLGGIWKNTLLWLSGRPGRPKNNPNYGC